MFRFTLQDSETCRTMLLLFYTFVHCVHVLYEKKFFLDVYISCNTPIKSKSFYHIKEKLTIGTEILTYIC